MKKLLLPLLCMAILSVSCNDSNRWDGTWDVDGEWEVWTATSQNNCFMLRVGPTSFQAVLESDATEENYLFSASEGGEQCWDRDYQRVGNELRLSDTDTVTVISDTGCQVTIVRDRAMSLNSNDAFTEISTVEVFCEPDTGCPPELIACAGTGEDATAACTAEFASIGLRCVDCWVECDGGARIADPQVVTATAP